MRGVEPLSERESIRTSPSAVYAFYLASRTAINSLSFGQPVRFPVGLQASVNRYPAKMTPIPSPQEQKDRG